MMLKKMTQTQEVTPHQTFTFSYSDTGLELDVSPFGKAFTSKYEICVVFKIFHIYFKVYSSQLLFISNNIIIFFFLFFFLSSENTGTRARCDFDQRRSWKTGW